MALLEGSWLAVRYDVPGRLYHERYVMAPTAFLGWVVVVGVGLGRSPRES